MDFVFDVLAFSAKGFVVVLAILVVLAAVMALGRRGRRDEARLQVRRLNQRFRDLANGLRGPVLGPKLFKQHMAAEEKAKKAAGKAARRVYVLDFDGDMAASAVAALREEISAVLGVATDKDEVVLRLESSGGLVHAYGLAASQVARLKDRKIRLTVCVDKIAASGGYMMACLGDTLVAAPFAVIGSIGVVASVPNLHRLLERHGVDYEEMTAGEFKRTVSIFGKISPEGRQKLQDQLEETHDLFKRFVVEHRPQVKIDQVATGEYWFATKARELGLVDRLLTSDDYLLAAATEADVFQVTFKPSRPLRQRVLGAVGEAAERLWGRLASRPAM